jgi:hypothetical protein
MTDSTQSTAVTTRSLWKTAPIALAAAAFLFSAASCKKKPPPPPPANTSSKIPTIDTSAGSNGTFGKDAWVAEKAAHLQNVTAVPNDSYAHVSYKPNVTIVDKSTFDSCLEGIGSTGHGIVFKNAPANILALKAGDIFMVKGQFAAKILAAETTGDETVVVTDAAKLTDIIASGTLHLNTGINFHGPAISSVHPPAPPPAPTKPPFHFMDLLETPVYAQNGTGTPPGPNSFTPANQNPAPGVTSGSATSHVTGAVSDLLSGWTVENFAVTPANNSAAISAKMTKSVGGFVAAVSLDGTVSNFQFAQNLNFPNINVSQITNGIKGMSGTMHFVWEIGKSDPGGYLIEDKIKLPAGITIPLAEMLDGLPLTLDISAALLIHPGLTGGNEYEKGGFTIGFGGDQSAESLTFQIDSDQSISPIAPAVMVIAFCVPRVELRLGLVGSYASDTTASITGKIDSAIGYLVGKLPAGIQKALNDSPLGKMSITNALASNADLFVQVVHTQGVTHAANITLAPCSKVQIRVTGQWGGDATLFNLIPGASSTKDLYTKEFIRWNPGSDFCKSV